MARHHAMILASLLALSFVPTVAAGGCGSLYCGEDPRVLAYYLAHESDRHVESIVDAYLQLATPAGVHCDSHVRYDVWYAYANSTAGLSCALS